MENPQRPDNRPTNEDAPKVDPSEILDQKAYFEFRQNMVCLLNLMAMFVLPPIVTSLGVEMIDNELMNSKSLNRSEQLRPLAAFPVFFSVVLSIWLSANLSARLKFIALYNKKTEAGALWIFLCFVFIGMITYGLKDQFSHSFEFRSEYLKNNDFLFYLIIGSNIIWGITIGFALKAPWDVMRDNIYDSIVKKRARQGLLLIQESGDE